MIAMNRLNIVEEPIVIVQEPEDDENGWDDGLVVEPRWGEARMRMWHEEAERRLMNAPPGWERGRINDWRIQSWIRQCNEAMEMEEEKVRLCVGVFFLPIKFNK